MRCMRSSGNSRASSLTMSSADVAGLGLLDLAEFRVVQVVWFEFFAHARSMPGLGLTYHSRSSWGTSASPSARPSGPRPRRLRHHPIASPCRRRNEPLPPHRSARPSPSRAGRRERRARRSSRSSASGAGAPSAAACTRGSSSRARSSPTPRSGWSRRAPRRSPGRPTTTASRSASPCAATTRRTATATAAGPRTTRSTRSPSCRRSSASGARSSRGARSSSARRGFRAEYARPLALLDHRHPDDIRERGKRLENAAEAYSIPLLERDELIAYAALARRGQARTLVP